MTAAPSAAALRESRDAAKIAARGTTGGPLPIEFRTLRVGMRVTLLAPLAAAAMFVLASKARVTLGVFGLGLTALAVAAALATLLPWERLLATRAGMRVLAVWSVTALGMVTIGVWATGGARSPLVLLYALTTVFFAVAFSPRGQVALLAMTLVGYGLALRAADQGPLPLIVLSVLTFLAGFLVQEIRVQVRAAWDARAEADRRWALLATVSAAARDMSSSTADVDHVLETTIDAVEALGFPFARVFVREGEDWHTVPDLPAPDRSVPSVVKTAAESGEFSVFRGRTAGLPMFGATVPIKVSDGVAAVLVVGSESAPGPSPQDVEVFRMLASQATLALENVRRFEEQRHVIERLAELDRMKNDFLSTVSHELRTPLTVITGMGRTLELQWDTIDEEIRVDFLARLNANAATLDHVIAELLDFSKLEAGQLRPDAREVDLSTMIPALVDRIGTLFADHILEVEVEPGLRIEADPGLLERVVENLLSNASKYTPAGSHVTVAARNDGSNHVIVSVADDGPGIPDGEVARIGERFFRGGDVHTRSTRGTGLGLAVVSEILELHGSKLQVDTRVGEGTTFRFRLATTGVPAPPPAAHRPADVPVLDERARAVVPSTVPPGLRGERFETVMTAASTGVEWAIALFYREFHPAILRYLRARGAKAPEATAERVWLEVARDLQQFTGNEAAFRRWLFELARRALVEPVDETDGPIEVAGAAPLPEALAKVASLPAEHADVLLLRALGHLEVDDVAILTGQDTGAVRLLEMDALRLLQDAETAAAAEVG